MRLNSSYLHRKFNFFLPSSQKILCLVVKMREGKSVRKQGEIGPETHVKKNMCTFWRDNTLALTDNPLQINLVSESQ